MLALTRGPHRRPEPYHIVAEIQDPAEPRGGRAWSPATRRHRRQARDDRAADRADRAAVRRLGRLHRAVRLRRRRGLLPPRRVAGRQDLRRRAAGLRGLLASSAWPDPDGSVQLNPPASTVDRRPRDDRRSPRTTRACDAASPTTGDDRPRRDRRGRARRPEPPSRALIIGWNDRGRRSSHELDQYVTRGLGAADRHRARRHRASRRPANLSVTVQRVPRRPTARRSRRSDVASLRPGHRPVLLRRPRRPARRRPHAGDAAAPARHARRRPPRASGPRIVSEMLDDRNRELAQVTEVDDVIVSDKILSLVLAQLSENAAARGGLRRPPRRRRRGALPAPGRASTSQLGRELSFATIVEAARSRGETAIGFRVCRRRRRTPRACYGVRVNPAEGHDVHAGGGRSRRRAGRGLEARPTGRTSHFPHHDGASGTFEWSAASATAARRAGSA